MKSAAQMMSVAIQEKTMRLARGLILRPDSPAIAQALRITSQKGQSGNPVAYRAAGPSGASA
jgi:hypothetical protein